MKALSILTLLLAISASGFCQNATSQNHNLKGDEYLKKGDTINAISEYSKTIEINPKNFYALKKRGILKSTKNDFGGAVKDFTSCIKLKQDDPEVYYQRGLALQKSAGDPGAISFIGDPFSGKMTPDTSNDSVWINILNDYKAATKLNPGFVDAYKQSAFIKGKRLMGDFGDPLDDFNAIIKLQPNNIETLNLRGVYKANKKDYQGAETDFTSIFTITPKDTLMLQNLISVEVYLQKYSDAIMYCDKFIAECKNKGVGYFYRAVCKSFNKDFTGCIGDFDQAIALSPTEASYYLNRGYIKITELKLTEEGCKDLNMAKQYGDSQAQSLIDQYCK